MIAFDRLSALRMAVATKTSLVGTPGMAPGFCCAAGTDGCAVDVEGAWDVEDAVVPVVSTGGPAFTPAHAASAATGPTEAMLRNWRRLTRPPRRSRPYRWRIVWRPHGECVQSSTPLAISAS